MLRHSQATKMAGLGAKILKVIIRNDAMKQECVLSPRPSDMLNEGCGGTDVT